MRHVRPLLVLLLIPLMPPPRALAQTPTPRTCNAPEFHQFDFWAGSWTVTTPDGNVAGTNEIDPVLDGCALIENWQGTGGLAGKSLNFYDAGTGHWYQTWVSAVGPLWLKGGLEDGRMVLRSTNPDADVLDRITWIPDDDGSVEQRWEQSEDGGKTWKVVFLGTYRKADPAR